MAVSASGTSFSALIYVLASSGTGVDALTERMYSASGRRPRSRAIIARVRRFGLYGRYRSSSFTEVSAASIAARSSSVRFPCSWIDVRMVSLRLSRFRK